MRCIGGRASGCVLRICLTSNMCILGAMYLAASKTSDVDDNWTRFLLDRPVRPSTNATLYNAVRARCKFDCLLSCLLDLQPRRQKKGVVKPVDSPHDDSGRTLDC